MEKRYAALRIVGWVFKIIGIITGILTILGALGLCGSIVLGGAAMDQAMQDFGGETGYGIFGGLLGGLIAGLTLIIAGGWLTITQYALGEVIFLLVALEENTRTTTVLLQRQLLPQP